MAEDKIRKLVRKSTGHDISNDADNVKKSYLDSVNEKDRSALERLQKLVADYSVNAKTADKRTQEIDEK